MTESKGVKKLFLHHFKSRLKIFTKNKTYLFWTLLFPIAMATLFNMAFSNFISSETFSSLKVAIIDNEAYQNDTAFSKTIEEVISGENPLLDVVLTNEENAKALLDKDEILGYITVSDKIDFTIKNTGIKTTIVKSFLDSYTHKKDSITDAISNNPTKYKEIIAQISNSKSYLVNANQNKTTADTTQIYFFSLIAMSCLYGMMLGLANVSTIQANQSFKAARINIAPINKISVLISYSCASTLIIFIENILTFIYIKYILGIEFGTNIPFIILTILISSIFSISLGTFIGVAVKSKESVKLAIGLAITLIGCFLSGMMGTEKIKYFIQLKAPIISYINPANLITDAFYSLYFYNTYDRYCINIVIMLSMTLIFTIISYFIVRRNKYASL